MDIVRKSIEAMIDPESLTDATPEKPFGGFKAVASDESRDRDQENLYKSEWITPLPDHITVDMDHGMSVATTVGSAKPFFQGDELWIDASFSSIERAQEVRALVIEGHIKTVSVAALVDRSLKSGTPRRELLNVGIVAIPSNRNAVIFDAKSVTQQTVNEAAVNFLLAVKAGTAAGNSDGAMVQAIHDAAGHLGAACIVVEVPVEADPEDPSGAAEGANKGLDAGVIDKVSEIEADVVPEIEGDTPEVEADTQRFTTQEILDAVLGSNKSIEVDGLALTADQFKDALEAIVSNAANAESPANPPVSNAAAATDEVPAPADEAAGEAAESEVVEVERRAAHMAMLMWANESD